MFVCLFVYLFEEGDMVAISSVKDALWLNTVQYVKCALEVSRLNLELFAFILNSVFSVQFGVCTFHFM